MFKNVVISRSMTDFRRCVVNARSGSGEGDPIDAAVGVRDLQVAGSSTLCVHGYAG